jgi:peptidoglycan/xylan/chitin deacetylase (PgdA/CDA1 family)
MNAAKLGLALTTVLVTLAGASSASAAPTKHSGTHHQATVTGTGLQLASTQLIQTGDQLTFTVALNRSREDFDFSRKSNAGICALLAGEAPSGKLCIARSHQHWTAYLGSTELLAEVTTVGERGLSVSIPFGTSGVKAGKVKWTVRAQAAGCAPSAPECVGRLPATGKLTDKLWQPYAIGCTRTGAGEVTRGPAGKRVIALTFDDGPSGFTPAIRKILQREKVNATFFQLGQQVKGQAATVKGLLADGNELANHSWNHANLGGGGGGAASQITSTNNVIQQVTGFKPCLFRPPYGSTSSSLVSTVVGLGMTSVLWSVDTNDWQLPGASTIISRILGGASQGGIILVHDGGGPRGGTVSAVSSAIPTLKSRGYTFVTVSQLLGNKTTYGLKPVG